MITISLDRDLTATHRENEGWTKSYLGLATPVWQHCILPQASKAVAVGMVIFSQ